MRKRDGTNYVRGQKMANIVRSADIIMKQRNLFKSTLISSGVSQLFYQLLHIYYIVYTLKH